ncbi:MAG TPA: hypothetical protein VLK25_01360 [Allosphingosinicella sp.]|nr:hypothetical protein [Allosphingosinicella sp.]
MRLTRIVPLAALLALAACQEAPEKKAPTAAKAAEPAAAEPQGPLAIYVGKTAFEPVEGTAFADHERVSASVLLAVRNEEPRAWVLRRDTQQSPIMLENGRLQAHGCERGNCGARNWTILIDPAGAMAEVCFHEGGRTRWYGAGRTTAERPGECPGA